MSQENVEIMRRLYQSNAQQALVDLLADECVWISNPKMPGGGRYTGKEAVRRYLDGMLVFEDGTIEVHEIIDLGDRALGITTFRARAPDGPTTEWLWCHLVVFRNGSITEFRSFLDRESALEAAGLRE
jgi:ketosteroid isomerase-like protein